jgi:hypothetical protein
VTAAVVEKTAAVAGVETIPHNRAPGPPHRRGKHQDQVYANRSRLQTVENRRTQSPALESRTTTRSQVVGAIRQGNRCPR